MGRIERFEDIIAWKKARALVSTVYALTRQGQLARDFGLVGQMQRAAVSTMSNIAEGYERNALGKFQRYLTIAKASCAEVQSLLYVALDAAYIDQATYDRLRAQTEEVPRVIAALRNSVERRRSQS